MLIIMDMKEKVIEAYQKKILFTTHALNQMNSPQRMISKDEIKEVITKRDIIEDYPDDPRGHSCLMIGKTKKQRIIHVVCAPKEEYLAIITAYIPSLKEWKENLKTRRK